MTYSWVPNGDRLTTAAAWGRWRRLRSRSLNFTDLYMVLIKVQAFLFSHLALKGVPLNILWLRSLLCLYSIFLFELLDLWRHFLNLRRWRFLSAVSLSDFLLLPLVLFVSKRIKPACLIPNHIDMVYPCHCIDLSEDFVLSDVILNSEVYLYLL